MTQVMYGMSVQASTLTCQVQIAPQPAPQQPALVSDLIRIVDDSGWKEQIPRFFTLFRLLPYLGSPTIL